MAIMKKWNRRKILRTIWFSLVLLFLVWNWTSFQAHNLPVDVFSNSDIVSVEETKDQITFHAEPSKNKLEIIFFQGGMTDPKAYAPLCRKIAEEGFTCHLIKMKHRLPKKDCDKVFELFDLAAGDYIIGGHSQGAKMAAQLVYENPATFKGLFLLATSHPRDVDLSELTIPCLKLYAENDGLASVEKVRENMSKLPKDTELVFIKGGNHSQFGYLGKLPRDNAADISLKEQQQQTLDNMKYFLNGIGSTHGRF